MSKLEAGDDVVSDGDGGIGDGGIGDGGNGIRKGVFSGRNRTCCPSLILVPLSSLAGSLPKLVSASELVCHRLEYWQ